MFGGNLNVGRREYLFFGLHPIIGGKLDVGRRGDLFFFLGLHLTFGGKLDVGRREDLVEMSLTVTFISDYF